MNSFPNQIKYTLDNIISDIDFIKHLYTDSENDHFSRNRKLGFAETLRLILAMNGGTLQKELYEFKNISGIELSASAFVQQRSKIKSEAFYDVLKRFNKSSYDTKKYKEYRLLAVDGSTINMYQNKKSECYMEKASNPYTAYHLNALYDLENKIYYDCVLQPQPKADEIGALLLLLKQNSFKERNIILLDRGYESYNTFAWLHFTKNVDFICRIKQNKAAMREVQKLPMEELDVNISFTLTTSQRNIDKQEKRIFLQTGSKKGKSNSSGTRITRWDFPSPYEMQLRIVRFALDSGEYETIATSLPASFTINEIKKLYHKRWGIETSFRELKYAIGLVNLHSKKDDLVRQEIYSALIMYNFCSRIIGNVIVTRKSNTKYDYKVNFKMALTLCKKFYASDSQDGYALIQEILKYTEPIRPNRVDKRNLKTKAFVGFTYRVSA